MDLEAIHDFIARDSAHYARLLCADIVAAVDQLADYPQLGTPSLSSKYRSSGRRWWGTTAWSIG